MKVKLIYFTLVIFTSVSLFSQDKVTLENRKDSVSYAVGVSMYQGAQQFKIPLDYQLVARGFLAAADSNALVGTEDANEYINHVIQQVNEQHVKRNISLGERFLEENKKAEGIKVTQSGLQYRVIQEGYGNRPSDTDRVKVDYTGYLLDGTKFDSSQDRGQSAVFGVNSVIPGWTEILKLMREGSEYVVYIPHHLAYGERQMGKLIEPGSTLMFEIHLLEIVE